MKWTPGMRLNASRADWRATQRTANRISARVLDAKRLRPERSNRVHHAGSAAKPNDTMSAQFSGVAAAARAASAKLRAGRPTSQGDLPLRFEIRQATDKPEPTEQLRVDSRARDKEMNRLPENPHLDAGACEAAAFGRHRPVERNSALLCRPDCAFLQRWVFPSRSRIPGAKRSVCSATAAEPPGRIPRPSNRRDCAFDIHGWRNGRGVQANRRSARERIEGNKTPSPQRVLEGGAAKFRRSAVRE